MTQYAACAGASTRQVAEPLTEHLEVVGGVQRRVTHDPELQHAHVDPEERALGVDRPLHVVREARRSPQPSVPRPATASCPWRACRGSTPGRSRASAGSATSSSSERKRSNWRLDRVQHAAVAAPSTAGAPGSGRSRGIRSRPVIPKRGLHDRVHQVDQGTERLGAVGDVDRERLDPVEHEALRDTRESRHRERVLVRDLLGPCPRVQVPVLAAVGEDVDRRLRVLRGSRGPGRTWLRTCHRERRSPPRWRRWPR